MEEEVPVEGHVVPRGVGAVGSRVRPSWKDGGTGVAGPGLSRVRSRVPVATGSEEADNTIVTTTLEVQIPHPVSSEYVPCRRVPSSPTDPGESNLPRYRPVPSP